MCLIVYEIILLLIQKKSDDIILLKKIQIGFIMDIGSRGDIYK